MNGGDEGGEGDAGRLINSLMGCCRKKNKKNGKIRRQKTNQLNALAKLTILDSSIPTLVHFLKGRAYRLKSMSKLR